MQIITDRSQALTAIRTDLGAIRWFGGTAAGYACLPRRSRRRGSAGRRLRRLRVRLNHAQLRKIDWRLPQRTWRPETAG
jgi:hypothetical protein